MQLRMIDEKKEVLFFYQWPFSKNQSFCSFLLIRVYILNIRALEFSVKFQKRITGNDYSLNFLALLSDTRKCLTVSATPC